MTSLPERTTRRRLARDARDAFPPMGVYAIRDGVTGRTLVRASRDVPAAIRRMQFELRLGGCRDKQLQQAWAAGGAERVAFDVLEMVRERKEADFDYEAELRLLEQLHREETGARGEA